MERDLYIFKISPIDGGKIFYKVGMSQNIEQRRKSIEQINSHTTVTVIAVFPEQGWAEKMLLLKLKEYKIYSEYFRSNPVLDLADSNDVVLMDLLYYDGCMKQLKNRNIPRLAATRIDIRNWQIRRYYAESIFLKEELARLFNLAESSICQILKRKRWSKKEESRNIERDERIIKTVEDGWLQIEVAQMENLSPTRIGQIVRRARNEETR